MSSEQEQEEGQEPRAGAVLPLVAIVGRPNVGKSTLFNRLVGERRSIVGDEPGITRDRIYGESEWAGRRFSLVDTGGIVPDETEVIPANIFRQAEFAITEAAMLVWVVDARAGATPLDEELARLLRTTDKPVLVAANKVDTAKLEALAGEFHRFGFDEVLPISAENSDGVAELLDALVERLPPAGASRSEEEEADERKREVRLAIVGRPNVGKSSLLNRLLGEERVIVSEVAGTTRDAVDTVLEAEGRTFRLIDTAGIRRKGKTEEMAEKLSVVMARRSLERADVAVVVVDAVEGVAALDANIAGYALDAGCSIILAVNKWDAVPDKDNHSVSVFERDLRFKMRFLEWAPVMTISALAGQRVDRLLPLAAARTRGAQPPHPDLAAQRLLRARDGLGARAEYACARQGRPVAAPRPVPHAGRGAPAGLRRLHLGRAPRAPLLVRALPAKPPA